MALAAEHDLGAARSARARPALKPVDAVLADADDGQPARRCGTVRRDRLDQRHAGMPTMTYPHSRRHHRGAATWQSGSPAAPISTSTLSLAGRTAVAGAAAGAGAQRRLRRRRRASRTICVSERDRRADRRDASLCRVISANAGAAARDRRRAIAGAAPAGLDRGRRRSLDRGRRRRRGGARARRSAAPGVSSRSAATSSRLRATRRSIFISSAASIRSIRRSPLPHVDLS